MNLIEILVVSEIIIVNMLTVSRCCKRKYPLFIYVITFFLTSIGVLALGYTIIHVSPFYGNGNGLFVLFGFLYLIPLKLLFDESLFQLFIIICMSWVYTLGIFAISVQMGKVLDDVHFQFTVLIIESILFLVFTYPFYKTVVSEYFYILDHFKKEKKKWNLYLSFCSILHMITMLGVNFVFAMEKGSVAKVIVMLLLLSTMFFMYHLLYLMITQEEKVEQMNETIHHDELTGLYNRLSLFDDLGRFLKKEIVFTVLFLDLDHFKKVNDTYGHVIGDMYLQHFAKIMHDIIKDKGTIYRFGGDEFIIIYKGKADRLIMKELQECKHWDNGAPCPFYQVSIGSVVCVPPHMSMEMLLTKVDHSMYEKKAAKK